MKDSVGKVSSLDFKETKDFTKKKVFSIDVPWSLSFFLRVPEKILYYLLLLERAMYT